MRPTVRFNGFKGICAMALLILGLYGCGTTPPAKDVDGYRETGLASYYAHKFHGRKTASGERYDEKKLTAAHPKLPFDTMVYVVNLRNGKQVKVRINDRGPFVKGRVIDLSYAAAKELGMVRAGILKVAISATVP